MMNDIHYWSRIIKNYGRPESMSQSLVFFHVLTYQYNDGEIGAKLTKQQFITHWLNDKLKIVKIEEDKQEVEKKMVYVS